MQRKMSHRLIRAVFLPFSVALVISASLSASEAHPLGDEGRRGSVSGHLKQVMADQIVVVIDRTVNREVKQGTEVRFELTPQTEFMGEQGGQSLSPADMAKGRPVLVAYTVRSGQVVADRVRLQPGPPITFEEQKPRPPTPYGLEQPWQTSWAAFCNEVNHLYRQGTSADKMDTIFMKKPVIWEGEITRVAQSENEITVRMPSCHVVNAANDTAEVLPLVLRFKNSRDMSVQGSITIEGKKRVRFATAMGEPVGLGEGHILFHVVDWKTVKEKGKVSEEQIIILTGEDAKLLGYVKSDDNP